MRLYCQSRFQALRRPTSEVKVGPVGVGANNPIRVQSMTTSLTQDVAATVKQCIRLAEAGCEIVRITAPNKAAAQALKDIREGFTAAGFGNIPLVADIHFLPNAAMVAIEHVEKVRVNPGNYADKKKFAVKEYTDSEYDSELQRLHEAFSPLVKRAKELGRALRIGTNHGSLSDRIMNRYGDSPLGMVESALEFMRIADDHNFRDIIVSMKASNTKVMIEAYRLATARMDEAGFNYPLHLGVTEAGDGEDARIKSAIGIGALLYDGLGDTIRVSLTEDPWYEVPVARDLADRAHALWENSKNLPAPEREPEAVNPYEYRRREVVNLSFGEDCPINALEPPRVIAPSHRPLSEHAQITKDVLAAHKVLKDARIEGLLVQVKQDTDLIHLLSLQKTLAPAIKTLVAEIGEGVTTAALDAFDWNDRCGWMLVKRFGAGDTESLKSFLSLTQSHGLLLAVDADAATVSALNDTLAGQENVVHTLSAPDASTHPVGAIRALGDVLLKKNLRGPLWLRMRGDFEILHQEGFGRQLLEAAMYTGPAFADGFGDLLSIDTVDDLARCTALAYNILQGARMRTVKTEYVACPSCGRTLFDLQEVTGRIKARTGHLKGVTIAVMGCIVNGPGEMADADFGYVGGAPAKINLYVGKECVEVGIPEAEALDRLVDLIRSHGKWVEPEPEEVEA
ncbi:(E)-4-hydroxy-3-methylbut-2-enyl-diphosphate synthase [Ruficoccus amylovorans]|uniref:4-hydroxy-3-methylbut-2-en-1-yl diphosphate synthase (flavodoxin) n=1 Tax=Ruficoccus amylovorans TaxID=1804625 RepID=A0A842HLQ6_9BACT|nr:(E)-4-hydroxy-3-methylbut-2-enyl-diphosphate synthase [Ruficoccus amylovorans]MBC2596397.1 (E)-4-hydroxy-3-methylbut-2-enyl-diphosphate synthase [Ruficoccus amylovorans]